MITKKFLKKITSIQNMYILSLSSSDRKKLDKQKRKDNKFFACNYVMSAAEGTEPILIRLRAQCLATELPYFDHQTR